MKKILLGVFLASLGISQIAAGGESAPNPSKWKLGANTETGASGVSPGVLKIGSTTYLYPTGGGGMQVWKSTDGFKFSQITPVQTPKGADASVVTLDDGTYRMYYARAVMGSTPGTPGQPPTPSAGPQAKTMYSATSTDGVNWTDDPGVRIEDAGIGVPDVVRAADGTYFATWVTFPGGVDAGLKTKGGTAAGNCSGENGPPEILSYATSTDGLTFTTESEPLLEGGFVDPNFARAKKNDWVMVTSTGPSNPPQRLCIGTSKNGTTWTVQKQALTPASEPSFDPTVVAKGKGFLVYYSKGDVQPKPGEIMQDPPIVVAKLTKK